ncbi:hypothetical protein ID855_17990, partial [Xenorhabdus sp. ZM]|nr:hypothetical protein [Xenorhabdus sp. ZM]
GSGCSSGEHHFRCSHTVMAAPAHAGQGFQGDGLRPFCPGHFFGPDVHFRIVFHRQRANVVRFTGRRATVLRVQAAESLPAAPLRHSGAAAFQVQHCVCMTACFVQGKPPAGAARGGDGEHGNEQGAKRLRAARRQCSGVGAGEVN